MQIYEKKGNYCRFKKKDITLPMKIGREMFVRPIEHPILHNEKLNGENYGTPRCRQQDKVEDA